MAEFKTDQWGGVRLVVPDKPTVYQIVAFDSKRLEVDGLPPMIILWEMAKLLIQEWESEVMPDFKADLEKLDDPRQARIIEWAGLAISAYRRGLDAVPKNS
jgi:hypothetical protein